jgi:hypothetical protein
LGWMCIWVFFSFVTIFILMDWMDWMNWMNWIYIGKIYKKKNHFYIFLYFLIFSFSIYIQEIYTRYIS